MTTSTSTDRFDINGDRARRYRLMLEAGRDYPYIARRMGVDEKTVDRWRIRLGIRKRSDRKGQYDALFKAGRNDAYVMKAMGVEAETVARHRRRFEGKVRQPIKVDYDDLAERYNARTEVKHIAQALGVSEKTVYKRLERAREMGLITREKQENRPYTEEELERAKALLEDRMSYTMVLEEIGRPASSLSHLSKKLPGYGWTQSEAQQYRWMKQKLESL